MELTAKARWSGHLRQRELHVRRQAEQNEVICGVKVVLAGFVDHAHQAVFGSRRILHDWVQLPPLKRGSITIVSDTEDEIPASPAR